MKQLFNAAFFISNRQRLREQCPGMDLIVVTANGLLQRSGDTTFPFRQDSNFWYLTGIDEPDIILVMEKDNEYLIVPAREAAREAFDGALDQQTFTSQSGITEILGEDNGWDRLSKALQLSGAVATPASSDGYIARHGFYTNPARARLLTRMRQACPQLACSDIRPQLARLRMVKQKPELTAIRQAIDITVSTLDRIASKGLESFQHEYEVEAEITKGLRSQGASGHGYEPIVAGGLNACTLHYIANSAPLSTGQLLLIDAGAAVHNYSADITRTYALGEPTERQQAVHAAVLDIQRFALKQLKPGITIKENEKLVEQYMGDKLMELKLIHKNEPKLVRRYYPHSTSHYLGLDVHDAGDYERPLEPGMVLTVEPGIYIPEEGIGVRIEDDIVITTSGNEVLSEGLPRSLT
jgi:Xaa-Pro aminopeptidase